MNVIFRNTTNHETLFHFRHETWWTTHVVLGVLPVAAQGRKDRCVESSFDIVPTTVLFSGF